MFDFKIGDMKQRTPRICSLIQRITMYIYSQIRTKFKQSKQEHYINTNPRVHYDNTCSL